MHVMLLAFLIFGHHSPKVDPSVAAVSKVYVKGDGEAELFVERKLRDSREKFGEDACFIPVGTAKDSEATLEIGQRETAGGINPIFAMGKTTTTTVVTGKLESAQGELLWSDSKQGVTGIVKSGAGSGATRLLESLWQAAGCGRWNGQRKEKE